MALYIDDNGKVQIITPPKTLTDKERKILEDAPVNRELIKEAMSINFNIVNG
jgi:predicted urease superfamily metal-dependent hydrolase